MYVDIKTYVSWNFKKKFPLLCYSELWLRDPECHIFEGHWHFGRRIIGSPLQLLVTNCLCVEHGC